MPYQYTNPGVAFARGMDRFLAEREATKRQQMLDDIAMRREKRLADSDAADMKMRQEEIKDRQAARKDAADLRERAFKLQEESAAEKAKVGREKTWLTREKHKQKGDIPDPSFIELAREFDPESLEEPGPDYQLPPEAQGPVPSTGPIRFGGRPDELAAEATRKRQQAFVDTLPAGNIRTRAEGKMVGLDLPAETADRTIGDVKEVGGYVYTQAPDGRWIKGERALGELGANSSSDRPYFTYQAIFDAQSRPVGAVRFDARGGPPTFIDISKLGGVGGQLRGAPGTLGAKSIENETSLDLLSNLQTMFQEGAKDFVGPLEGRARMAGQKIPGIPVNDLFSQFEAASATLENSIIRLITGAQLNKEEVPRIRRQIPLVSDKPEVWAAKAKQMQTIIPYLENRIKTKRPAASTPAPTGKYRSTVE